MPTDWNRIFPDADHRWSIGLQRGDLAEFLAVRDRSGAVCAERRRWLDAAPETYAALLPESIAALQETLELARSLGAKIEETKTPWEQLLSLGKAWEVDIAWMHPDGQGTHRLVGGVVCFPSSWDLREKLGLPMTEVHAPVPLLNDALARQIETFLSRQQPGVAWTRENVSFSRDAELNHHPARHLRPLDSTVTPDNVFVRLEHQLLLKLPTSGSILFGIRVEVVPLNDLPWTAQTRDRMVRLLSTIAPDVAVYKGIADSMQTLIELISV